MISHKTQTNQIIYILWICIKIDSVLNNLQWLISHKTQTNQIIYILWICIKIDSALNNLHWLISHKTQTNQILYILWICIKIDSVLNNLQWLKCYKTKLNKTIGTTGVPLTLTDHWGSCSLNETSSNTIFLWSSAKWASTFCITIFSFLFDYSAVLYPRPNSRSGSSRIIDYVTCSSRITQRVKQCIKCQRTIYLDTINPSEYFPSLQLL